MRSLWSGQCESFDGGIQQKRQQTGQGSSKHAGWEAVYWLPQTSTMFVKVVHDIKYEGCYVFDIVDTETCVGLLLSTQKLKRDSKELER